LIASPDKPRSGAIRGPFFRIAVEEWTPAFAGEAKKEILNHQDAKTPRRQDAKKISQ
jgi:hypothetical protein